MRLSLPAALASCALLLSPPGIAGPGAHGPGGEHLDGPAQVLSAGASAPRVEAKSETFELVARIEGGALSILIDRYDTNEPVLEANVEVEVASLKQKAVFRREQGDYAVTDPKLVALASSPGSHALVFTVNAGQESDLLEGTMQVAAPGTPSAATRFGSYTSIAAWIGGGVLVLGGAGAFLRRRRSAHKPGSMGGMR
jgi:hypothetical protein